MCALCTAAMLAPAVTLAILLPLAEGAPPYDESAVRRQEPRVSAPQDQKPAPAKKKAKRTPPKGKRAAQKT
jgi:c-di-GMP-binding flagellar brake protein YcgR